VLVSELGSYWIHRLSHQEGWLWRVHLLHHRPDRLNVANALTAHPINALYDKLVRVFPLILLGLNAEAMLAIALFTLTQSLVTHANVAGRIGILNYLIGSAELHRLHHSTVEHEAGNFGTAVPLWDQVFGTYKRGEAPVKVGVFDPKQYPGDLQLSALLTWPVPTPMFRWFQRSFRCCAASA
jgi:sterol desaturase/sphingolipid hydroxylase (fatty acid hydroxylase superfamily)